MKKYLPLGIIPPLVILLDQITKWIIHAKIGMGEKIPVIPGYFEIVHYRNTGAAFGMFSQWHSEYREWFFYGVTVVALVALTVLYIKTKAGERRIQIPLALILGGALGNLIDRIFRGSVIDFLRFHWQEQTAHFNVFGKNFDILLVWPSFNVADMAITCGALYLAVVLLFFEKKKPQNNLNPNSKA